MIAKLFKKVFLFYYRRMPWFSYYFFFLLAGLFGFYGYDVAIAYGILAPWLLFVLVVLNLPLVTIFFRDARLPAETKRNHLLEHGTIMCLEKAYGRKSGIGGRAQEDGFRIYGAIRNKGDIQVGFNAFLELYRCGKYNDAFSTRCGSTIIIVQAVGMLLLMISSVCFTIVKFEPKAVTLILALNFIAYIFIRKPIAIFVQRLWVMKMDFSNAMILSVTKVSKQFGEKTPVYFVKTAVELKS